MRAKIRFGTLTGTALPAMLVVLLAAGGRGLFAQEKPAAGPALITAIQLRKEAGELQLHFRLSAPARYEVVGNPAKRVLVVKFTDAVPGFPDGRLRFAYNDPYLAGVVFEIIDAHTTWAKIRLRLPNLAFRTLTEAPAATPAVGLRETVPLPGIELVGVRLAPHEGASRMVIELSQVPRYELQQSADTWVIRLKGVAPQPGLRAQGEDERVVLLGAESAGEDTLLRVRAKQPTRATPMLLTEPARLVVDFAPAPPPSPAPPATAAQPAPRGAEAERPAAGPAPENLEDLLAEEKDPAARGNYAQAEREFRSEHFRAAAELFRSVYQASPQRRLGLRAFFRFSDATYEQLVKEHARNFHEVIINYQAALRAAEAAGYESELIPRTLFQIGRSYQAMGFHNEATAHFEILENRFPNNVPYTANSYYYRGESLLASNRWNEAVQLFRRFLELEGDPELQGPAYYKIGDSLYNQTQYAAAKREFDEARRIAPAYANDHPLLLFHMGETYYENAEFEDARLVYRTLLDRYPTKPYAKLVALRLGDFLRDEGKEEEALQTYRQVIADAPLEIKLRGKMRIANIYAQRPAGNDYEKAITLYDEVIKEALTVPIAQEAHLRKALTLTLHNRYQPAIEAFEALKKEYPDSPYLSPNIYQANIDENLKGQIDVFYRGNELWEVAKFYTRYRDSYFARFRFKVTLFQVASAYHVLGLYDEALGLYKDLSQAEGHSLVPLARYRAALAYVEKDDLAGAEDRLLRFIKDYPSDPYRVDARMELGEIYGKGRRFEEAVNAYRLIVTDFEKSETSGLGEAVAEAYYRLGDVFKELGQMKNAADAFQNAIVNFHHPIQGPLVPDFIIASHFLIGDMYFGLGQDDDALRFYQDAIARYPQHDRTPWAWYQIGLIYRRKGDDAKALETFNTLVEMAKTRPGEMWESLARDNQRELVNVLQFQDYLKQ